ncbi:MAG TPA: hypothetical protein VJ438_03755 [Candidatus Nanoarchaeia archaeon]|nr:hypothetical protein [Candidatus Nanoarchaeia archaeon]
MLFNPKYSGPLSQNMMSLVHNFGDTLEKRVDKLKDKSNNTSPSSAVELMANLNFHRRDIPEYFFDNIDYNGIKSSDDLIVLGNLWNKVNRDKGIVDISPPERKQVGKFVLQYNYIRGFRPPRAAQAKDIPLYKPFNLENHNFMKPEFKKQEFYSMKMEDINFDFFFNKYPFAPGHFLLVPDKEEGHNQYLNPNKDINVISTVSEIMQRGEFGSSMRLGFNSFGAHASLNQLHWQGFFIEDGWQPPLEEELNESIYEHENTVHCFRNEPYNTGMWFPYPEQKTFTNFLEKIIDENHCFNLYYTPKGIALFERRNQGNQNYSDELKYAPFTTGYAFFEMMGEIICPDRAVFDKMIRPENEDEAVRQISLLYRALRCPED